MCWFSFFFFFYLHQSPPRFQIRHRTLLLLAACSATGRLNASLLSRTCRWMLLMDHWHCRIKFWGDSYRWRGCLHLLVRCCRLKICWTNQIFIQQHWIFARNFKVRFTSFVIFYSLTAVWGSEISFIFRLAFPKSLKKKKDKRIFKDLKNGIFDIKKISHTVTQQACGQLIHNLYIKPL